jgi:hypothetical protein
MYTCDIIADVIGVVNDIKTRRRKEVKIMDSSKFERDALQLVDEASFARRPDMWKSCMERGALFNVSAEEQPVLLDNSNLVILPSN